MYGAFLPTRLNVGWGILRKKDERNFEKKRDH